MSGHYYADDSVTLYHGDCREVVPALGITADCIVADPPYGETSLAWDRWPDGWPAILRQASRSMWWRAAVHVMTVSAAYGLVALPACEGHAPIARAAGRLVAEHAHEGWCGFPGARWHEDLNVCLIDDSGVEPVLVGASTDREDPT